MFSVEVGLGNGAVFDRELMVSVRENPKTERFPKPENVE
jgi:hypothetical protein